MWRCFFPVSLCPKLWENNWRERLALFWHPNGGEELAEKVEVIEAVFRKKGRREEILYYHCLTPIHIPNDISVVSFGDIPLASMLEVPLTTIRTPFVEIGKTAGRLLMDLIEGQDLKIKNVVFPVGLIIRNTTKELTQ